MKRVVALVLSLMAASLLTTSASAQERIKFLLPGPPALPAFVQFQLAKSKGYFLKEGFDVEFIGAKGGVDVAKQVAVGNGDMGTALADTVILVRPNGVPVKAVAQLGKGGLNQLIAREDSGIHSLKDLKGKRVGVGSFSQSSYYELLAVLGHLGIPKEQVDIQAAGPGGIAQMIVGGVIDAIVNPPEWALEFKAKGVPVRVLPIEELFPAMPQSLLASDDAIANRPKMVGAIVRGMLLALQDVIDNPKQAAADYVKAMPQYAGQEARFQEILQLYIDDVYVASKPGMMGAFDPKRFEAVQSFYLTNKVLEKGSPISELYTNAFVTPAK